MMTKTLNEGNIRCWALIASIAVHSAALGVFSGVKLSGHISPASAQRPASSISIQTIEHIVQQSQPQPHPKPQIEPILPPSPKPDLQPPLLAASEPAQPAPPIKPVQPTEAEALRQSDSDSVDSETESETVWQSGSGANEVEFFGQKSIVQRICYVVDCSGSMHGLMYQVRQQLKESILKLNSQQAFAVVFFMDGQKILTSGNGKLEPAAARAKSQALALIESIHPAGSTDAAHALDYAMRLKDPSGDGPELVYFLTDGFDLHSQRPAQFIENTHRLRNTLAPNAVLHTIGFCTEARDRQMLRQLAAEAGGEFIEVK